MAGNKDGRTEKATPKRRSEARKKGQVARSMEINSALIILALFVAIRTFGQNIFYSLSDLMRFFLSSPASFELNEKVVASLFLDLALLFMKIVLPIALVALVVGVIANIAQVGFLFTAKPLIPDAKKNKPHLGHLPFVLRACGGGAGQIIAEANCHLLYGVLGYQGAIC